MNASDSNQHRSLIEACQKGDKNALKMLYDTYSNGMYAICLRYMGNEDEAKDSLQEGFIKVFRHISRYAFTGSFEGWMKRIFVHTSIEQIRRRKRFLDIDDQQLNLPGQFSHVQLHQVDAEAIMEVVQRLPEGYRTIFNMYCIDGYSHKEIAEELGITESTSKSQLFKARKLLQKWLKHWF